MSYNVIKYEFTGQDSAGLRGGEVQFQVSKFFEPILVGMSRRILPWAIEIGTGTRNILMI